MSEKDPILNLIHHTVSDTEWNLINDIIKNERRVYWASTKELVPGGKGVVKVTIEYEAYPLENPEIGIFEVIEKA